jgi:hypothetical protein
MAPIIEEKKNANQNEMYLIETDLGVEHHT